MYLKHLLLVALILISAVVAGIPFKNLMKDVFSVNLDPVLFSSSDQALLRNKRESSSDERDGRDSQYYFTLGWKVNKLALLNRFIESLGSHVENSNLTLIGWENIHDSDGAIKEFRSIQFVIPPKPGRTVHEKDDDDDDDDVNYGRMIPHKLVNEIRDATSNSIQLDILHAAGIYELYNKAGEEEFLLYLDKDTMISKSNGFTIYNKTSVATQVEVDEFIRKMDSSSLKSILKYDINGQLTKDSFVSPHFLGSVTDFYEATDDILMSSPTIIAEIWAGHSRNEISKQLALSFNKKWPEWDWRVLVNPGYHYVSKDISITLQIDNLDFDETSDVKAKGD